MITKNFVATEPIDNTEVHFIPAENLIELQPFPLNRSTAPELAERPNAPLAPIISSLFMYKLFQVEILALPMPLAGVMLESHPE